MGNLIKICFSSPTSSQSHAPPEFPPLPLLLRIQGLSGCRLLPWNLALYWLWPIRRCPLLALSCCYLIVYITTVLITSLKKLYPPKKIWLSIPFGPQTKDLSVGTQVISNMNDSIPVSSHFQQDPSYQYSNSSHCLMCSVQSPRFRESWRCI